MDHDGGAIPPGLDPLTGFLGKPAFWGITPDGKDTSENKGCGLRSCVGMAWNAEMLGKKVSCV